MAHIAEAPHLNTCRLAPDLGNLLVLAPHPDDESLGCGGLITFLKLGGSSVSVIFVTSGSASHPNSRSHPPKKLSKLREAEAIAACAKLDIPKENVHFLRAADSALVHLDRQSLLGLSGQMDMIFESGKFSSLALPWRRDPHPDHRVVYELGNMMLKTGSKNCIKIEYPIWLWKNGETIDWPLESEIVPYQLNITDVAQKKREAIKCHKSQLGEIINDDPYGFVLTEALLEPFYSDTEYFFMTHRDLDTLDQSYFDGLYDQQEDPWDFRNSTYEQKKYERALKVLEGKTYACALELGCSIGIQTRMLSKVCRYLMAVDISREAVDTAFKYCSDAVNVQFKVADITKEFPKGQFDLITCCEIGYYFSVKDLEKMFRNISDRLLSGGSLLMVHWTPFVPDYPLSGDAVHDRFENFAEQSGLFHELAHERHERYRLQIWTKV